jgi:hypothetical protein
LQLRLVAHERAVELASAHPARGSNNKLANHAKAILIFEQRSQPRGQLFGKHREVAHAGIDCGGLSRRVLIDGSFFWYKSVDISDSHHDLDIAVGQAFGDFNLIKITGSIVVDGRPQELAKVAHSSSGSDLRRMRPQLRQLRRHFRRKIRLKAVVDHDLFRGGLQVDVRRAGGVHELPGKRIAYEVHLG